MTTPAAPLRIRGLQCSYGAHRAVEHVDLDVDAGTVHAVLGPNGAGKSTTIACAVGLLRPDAGEIRVFGADPRLDRAESSALMGVMLQDGGLPMSAKPLAVLRHLAALYGDPLPVEPLAERLGIDRFASRTVRRLSGGQRQRVALAAAIIGRPRLVFLDEPTAGLDPQSRLAVDAVVAELREDGAGIVLTTHDMHDAARLADAVTIVDHGRVIAAGTPEEVIAGGDGARTLRIRTSAAPSDRLLLALADLGVLHADGRTITLSGDLGTAEVRRALDLLDDAGAEVVDLDLHGRSLGDVFLELTGRELR